MIDLNFGSGKIAIVSAIQDDLPFIVLEPLNEDHMIGEVLNDPELQPGHCLTPSPHAIALRFSNLESLRLLQNQLKILELSLMGYMVFPPEPKPQTIKF